MYERSPTGSSLASGKSVRSVCTQPLVVEVSEKSPETKRIAGAPPVVPPLEPFDAPLLELALAVELELLDALLLVLLLLEVPVLAVDDAALLLELELLDELALLDDDVEVVELEVDELEALELLTRRGSPRGVGPGGGGARGARAARRRAGCRGSSGAARGTWVTVASAHPASAMKTAASRRMNPRAVLFAMYQS